MRRLLAVFLLLLCAGGAAAQGNDDALEAALVHWRAASWYLRTGNTEVAALGVDNFRELWPVAGIEAPEIGALADTAALALETDDAVTAGRSLAAIGDTLAELRRRAGLSGFPEAMRTYRDAVVRLSDLLSMSEQRSGAPFDTHVRAAVRNAATEALAAATRLPPLTPPRWAADAKLHELLQQNIDGLRNVLTTLDQPSARAAGIEGLEIAGLIAIARANYNILFLGYGY